MPVPYPAEKRAAIVETVRETGSSAEAARLHNVSRSTAQRYARAAELTKPNPNRSRRLTPEQRQEVKALLRKTHSAGGTARQLGVSPSTAWKIAKEEGIRVLKRGHHTLLEERFTYVRPLMFTNRRKKPVPAQR